MSIRISEETIVLVGVVIGIFLLALVFLACSLNGREFLDGSLFRCCRRRHRTRDTEENHHVYETLNEFIFEATDDTPERSRVVTFNNGNNNNNNAPTTMEQVFPDLLGSDETTWRGESPNGTNNNGSNNGDLMEPLL